MAKVQITFYTKHEKVAPDTEGPFAGLPQTKCLEYRRNCNVDYDSLFVGHTIDFYGKQYHITSYTLNKRQIGILVSEQELTQLLIDARQCKQRWKKHVGGSIDARGMVANAMYRASLN